MATKNRPRVEKQLINHRKVAEAIDVDTETLRKWVEEGDFPAPHADIKTTWLYDKAMIDHWLATGTWPAEAKFRGRGARKGGA